MTFKTLSAVVALGFNKLAVANSSTGAAGRIGSIYLTEFGRLLYATPLMWVVTLAPLAFVFFISARVERLSAGAARGMFLAFAAVMGASLSTLLIRYTGGSVVQTFFVTAAAFGALSLWGYTTRRSLSGFGSFLMMGVVGLVMASVLNMFLASSALQFAISAIGVLLFSALTAYDTRKLKEIALAVGRDRTLAEKASVLGAMTLYLDFVNLFQFLLSLSGNRNQ